MIAGNYYVKNYDSGVAHNVHSFPHGPVNGAVITTCGLSIGPWEEQYGKAQRAFPENITCKRCRKSLGLDKKSEKVSYVDLLPERPDRTKETVMDGKDIFYEVRMKDGSHEVIYDVMSAQEAADQVVERFDILFSEIECIHKIGVLKVIFPTIAVAFIE